MICARRGHESAKKVDLRSGIFRNVIVSSEERAKIQSLNPRSELKGSLARLRGLIQIPNIYCHAIPDSNIHQTRPTA